jgi:Xaa-Pro aminopeptidase
MISQKEYLSRRNKFAKSLKSHSISVLFSAMIQQRSNDTEYPYRQDSNFYYLSGFKEDNAVIVILKDENEYKSYLFVQKKDEQLELWTGKRLGKNRAKKSLGFDEVYIVDEFEKHLLSFIKNRRNLYFDFSMNDKRVESLKQKCKNINIHIDIKYLLGMARLIKSKAEIVLIKKAVEITKEAHHTAMRKAKELKYEYELQAEIEYIFKKNGAYSDAYTSIVACGNSANTLHYISNDKRLKNNELILIDAGCEYEYYSSDITRSIPVNGIFTEAQKELYQMILDVEIEIIQMIKPKILRTSLQEKSEELLCRGLISLGILKGSLKKLLMEKAHKKYYPHGIGHWMGLDVHDVSPYKSLDSKELLLKPGMVMTIEPGIYIDKDDKSVPKKYRGIGIRIEDDILVTKDGYENLSREIIKEISEIESL